MLLVNVSKAINSLAANVECTRATQRVISRGRLAYNFSSRAERDRTVSSESGDILISMKARAISAPRRIISAHEEERRIIVNQRRWQLPLSY